MQPQGIAKTNIEIVDLSVLIAAGLKGIHAVCGVTLWGQIGKPVLVGSWPEYVRNFGGLRADSLFPLICRRAIERGAKLLISPVGHYTDITDNTTLDGTAATGSITVNSTPETRATGSIIVTAAGADGNTITLLDGATTLATYTKVTGDTPTDVVTGLRSSANSLSSTTGWNATSAAATLTMIAPIGSGAGINGTSITRTLSGGATMTTDVASFNVTGGVTAVLASESVWNAESIGEWGDLVTVTTAVAASGVANAMDITISVAGYPELAQNIYNFPKFPTSSQIDNFNQVYKYAELDEQASTLANGMPVGSVTLSGGVKDITNIVNADYIGDSIALTGIHAFDNDTTFTKLACPAMAEPDIDMAIANYAMQRQDFIALTRTPVGIDGATVVDYREGTGIYSHQAIDTYLAFMFTGGVHVIDPLDGQKKYIPELGDIMGCMSTRDSKSAEWFSFSGSKRGRIHNCLGVAYNFGTPARETEADMVDVRGVNMVIQHPDFGVVSWGNSSLQKADTLLKHANVAELMVFMRRSLKPLVQSELFDPNDVDTWKAIHRRVIPFLDMLVTERGIWKYLYEGDQDIDDVSQAVVNQPANIDAGKYELRIWIAPKVNMKYIGIKVNVTNSSVDFEII